MLCVVDVDVLESLAASGLIEKLVFQSTKEPALGLRLFTNRVPLARVAEEGLLRKISGISFVSGKAVGKSIEVLVVVRGDSFEFGVGFFHGLNRGLMSLRKVVQLR